MSQDKMVAVAEEVALQRAQVEQVLAVYRGADGQGVTFESFVEVYAAIRPSCNCAEDCNALALHVYQILDNEDLPSGVTQQMVVDCATKANGVVMVMQSLVDQLFERAEAHSGGETVRKTAVESYIDEELNRPADHGIVYAGEEPVGEEPNEGLEELCEPDQLEEDEDAEEIA